MKNEEEKKKRGKKEKISKKRHASIIDIPSQED